MAIASGALPRCPRWLLRTATCFVRIDGLNIITDPVWALKTHWSSFHGATRYRPSPCRIEDLPTLDIGLISHNHYDHTDVNAIRQIAARFPEMRWYVPMGMKKLLETAAHPDKIHELSWGEKQDDHEAEIWCMPAQHWSGRGIFDWNESLWCGWAVVGSSKRKFYFAGDTGYCEKEFSNIGELHGPFDISAIPIGAYAPRSFEAPQHIDPSESVKVHKLVRSKRTLGIHWGTYDQGTAEFYLEPRQKLVEAMETEGLPSSEFFTLAHGATWAEEGGA